MHVPPRRVGGSLGALMIAIDVCPDQAAEIEHGAALARAIERCLTCPAARQCAAWLRDRRHDRAGYRGFCPNSVFLDAARRH
jgi:hypothetical protein